MGAVFIALFGACIALSGVYLLSVVYGFASGFALPTTAIFHLVPATELIVALEPSLANLLILVAAGGAAVSWLAWLGVLDLPRIEAMESALERMARSWGIFLPLCILLIVINSGGWSGQFTGHPSAMMSILNLLPWSDAIVYFGSSLDRATLDMWGTVAARRPLAQSLRDVTVFLSGYSAPATVLLQTVTIAFGLTLTAGRILAWRGIWAATAFVGFAALLLRPFLGTMMTEPLGWALAAFSCAYLCDAVRFHSGWHAIVALTGITLALVVRTGSMLTIPFLIVWIALAFGSNAHSRLRWGAIAIACVLAVIGLNTALNFIYSPVESVSSASFGFTLCGISVGGSWGDCYRLYGDEVAQLQEDQRALTALMLQKALANIAAHPTVILRSLVKNSVTYIAELPGMYLAQFNELPSWSKLAIIIVVAAGIMAAVWKRSARAEPIFWAALFLSTLASAAIVYADDGFRAMQVTYAVLAIPLAFAFASPLRSAPAGAALNWRAGAGGLIAVAIMALTIPGASHVLAQHWLHAHVPTVSAEKGETLMLGGRSITGLLVLPDGAERPVNVPSTHYADFRKMAEVIALQRDYAFYIDELKITPPFAFIIGMRINNGCCYYITVPDVLTKPAVIAWRLSPVSVGRGHAIREMRATPLP